MPTLVQPIDGDATSESCKNTTSYKASFKPSDIEFTYKFDAQP